MGKSNILLVTNCSATQSIPAPVELRGASLPENLTVSEAVKEWAKRLKAYDGLRIPPARLYRGVGFHALARCQEYVDPEDIRIVSIGQGLVGYKEDITPYDLSVDPQHANALQRAVTEDAFTPSYWWQSINLELRGSTAPLAELAAKKHYDLVVICCTSKFLALIVDDIADATLNPTAEAKLRIVVTSAAGVPNLLKPYIIQYDRRVSKASMGNRNNLNQRAALHFLQLLEGNSSGSIEDHRKMVAEALDTIQPLTEGGSESASDRAVKSLLKGFKKTDNPDAALAKVHNEHKLPISAMRFRKLWRAHFGIVHTGAKKNKTAAMSAMQSIGDKLSAKTVGQTTWKDEETALEGLGTFVAALRDFNPSANFSSAEVYAWAQQYYGSVDGEKPPTQLSSASKIGALLKSYGEEYGLIGLMSGPGQGAKMYRLTTDADADGGDNG